MGTGSRPVQPDNPSPFAICRHGVRRTSRCASCRWDGVHESHAFDDGGTDGHPICLECGCFLMGDAAIYPCITDEDLERADIVDPADLEDPHG